MKEKLNDIYQELLGWLRPTDKPADRIWHPLFYSYPWSLRFEVGEYALEDEEEYIRSAYIRGQRIFDRVFAPDDVVLLIFDGTPDRELKALLKGLRLQRVRAKMLPYDPEEEWEGEYFYRYLYSGPARDFPVRELLGESFRWRHALYFYNRTKKLLLHIYDDRGGDLLGPDAKTLEPCYRDLHDLLLDYDREEMARKFRPVRQVFLRILTTTTDSDRVAQLREKLCRKFRGAELTIQPLEPYWKIEGWGELSATLETARPLHDLQKQLSDRWEGDTASDGFRLPDVGFLWIGE